MNVFEMLEKKREQVQQKESMKLELINAIDFMLSDEGVTPDKYQKLLELAQNNGIKEYELKTMIRTQGQIMMKKKIRNIRDFEISQNEYDELWNFAQTAKIAKVDFEKMLESHRRQYFLPYIRKVISETGALDKSQKSSLYSLGTAVGFSSKEIEENIHTVEQEYKQKRRKEQINSMKKPTIIAFSAVLFAAILILISWSIYRGVTRPNLPQDLSVAPNPLFVLNDYLEGNISGMFKPKAMPKRGKIVITPYLEVENAKYYGSPVTFVGNKIIEKMQLLFLIMLNSNTNNNSTFQIQLTGKI